MQVERQGESFRIELTANELKLLRRALERASFIDTPVAEQAEIAAFCARALETLPRRCRRAGPGRRSPTPRRRSVPAKA